MVAAGPIGIHQMLALPPVGQMGKNHLPGHVTILPLSVGECLALEIMPKLSHVTVMWIVQLLVNMKRLYTRRVKRSPLTPKMMGYAHDGI